MTRTVSALLAGWIVVIGAMSGQPQAGSAGSPQAATPALASMAPRALVDKYCVTCHNQRMNTAGLALDTVELTSPPASAETW